MKNIVNFFLIFICSFSLYAKGKGCVFGDVDDCKTLADKGMPHGKLLLAQIYFYGNETTAKNYEKAAHYFLEAIEKPDPNKAIDVPAVRAEAYGFLGHMYFEGYFFNKDYILAQDNYWTACDLGFGYACYRYGKMFQTGTGVSKNDKISSEYYEKGALLNDASSQYSLARNYYMGLGVPKDLIMAYAYFNLSAMNGEDSTRLARDTVEKELSQEQLIEAQKISRELQLKLKSK